MFLQGCLGKQVITIFSKEINHLSNRLSLTPPSLLDVSIRLTLVHKNGHQVVLGQRNANVMQMDFQKKFQTLVKVNFH